MHSSFARFSLWLVFVNALLWLTPSQANSTDVPVGYYRVVDFGTGETVQLRADPSHSSKLMGTLNIDDVVFSDGTRHIRNDLTWQRVRRNQFEGWVEASHLWRTSPMTLAKTNLPAAGSCGASSPPWGLRWDYHSVRMSLFPENHEFIVHSVQPGVSPGTVLVNGSDPEAAMTFVYSDEICHGEGNTTLSWGSAYILIRGNGAEKLYKGCCNALRTAFTNK